MDRNANIIAEPSPTNGHMLSSIAPHPRGTIDELDVLIRARYPVIYVVTWEEERVEQRLAKIAAARNKKLFTWTCTQGIVRAGSEPPILQVRQR